MKKPYAKIEFTNCETTYDYTICPWSEVGSQIQAAQSSFEDVDEVGFNIWKLKTYLPEIKITLVMLTDKQWAKEFKSWDK